MAIPRANSQAEGTPWVNSAPADTTFSVDVPVMIDGMASVEVVYSGLDAADGSIRLKASNSRNSSTARNLTTDAYTLTTANSSIFFNIYGIGYNYLHAMYDPGSNSTGGITLYLARKNP